MVRRAHAMARAALTLALLGGAFGARAAPVPYLIESEFQPPRTYVGAETTLRLRLLRAPGLPYAVLKPPQLGDDAELIPIGTLRAYDLERAGVVYDVRERTYLVVPHRAGRIVLPEPELAGPLRQSAGVARPMRGAQRVLEVRAPRAAPGEPWLPARHLSVEESWSRDPSALQAGQPVVRTLVVRAEGLTGNLLPALRMADQPGLAVHHEASRFSSEYLDAGMAGRRVQRVVLIAKEEGEILLPALSLAWWDTVADAPRVATLPARTLRVGESALPAPAAAPAGEQEPLDVLRWFGAALFVLSGLALWLYARRQDEREAMRRLRAACERDDAAGARAALADWWQLAHRGAGAPLLLRMGEAWSGEARAALRALDAALYGGGTWNGGESWRAMKPWLRRRAVGERGRVTTAPELPPLFRLQARRP
jgi:hypothetical protein